MAGVFWENDTIGFTCLDCPDRHIACHQDCERYKKAKQRHSELMQKKKKAKELDRKWHGVRSKNYMNQDPGKGEY